MKALLCSLTLAAIVVPAQAQSNPDFRIRADFRTSHTASWGADESVGHAEFRVVSRFGHVYYGGVRRLDEFKFKVQLDYRGVSGFDTHFSQSEFNTNFDVYLNNGYVGRAMMSGSEPGLAELGYDSRHPSPPELPLPAGFPDPVNVGDVVTVFAAAGIVPAIGDPAPAGTPLFESELIERFARGDANQDGKVDEDDHAILASVYDPYHALGEHIGPMAGDFSGDNRADLADYQTLVANWTDSHDVPAEPAPVTVPCLADTNHDGFLDNGDITAFVQLFLASDPAADLNVDGFIDSGDIGTFVSVFLVGC